MGYGYDKSTRASWAHSISAGRWHSFVTTAARTAIIPPMTANPLRWTFRAQCLLGFVMCAALLAFALYTQYFQALVPCPLCIFQRVSAALETTTLI